jgi:hypothetical protein
VRQDAVDATVREVREEDLVGRGDYGPGGTAVLMHSGSCVTVLLYELDLCEQEEGLKALPTSVVVPSEDILCFSSFPRTSADDGPASLRRPTLGVILFRKR